MQELHVRLEPNSEPRCGYGVDAALALNRLYGKTPFEDITHGLIFPKAAEMSLRAPIDPLELALTVRTELVFAPAGTHLRYQLALDRENAAIIERGRQRHLKQLRAADRAAEKKRAARAAAQGTRSTRRHGKRKGGR